MDLLTTTQAAQLLGIPKRTFQRMINQGTITPAHKLPGPGGSYLFNRTDLPDKDDRK